jgi:hypothetical protein
LKLCKSKCMLSSSSARNAPHMLISSLCSNFLSDLHSFCGAHAQRDRERERDIYIYISPKPMAGLYRVLKHFPRNFYTN